MVFERGAQHPQVASHFLALPLAQSFESFFAFFAFFAHHSVPFLSSSPHAGGGGGDETPPHTPHVCSHLAAILSLLHLLSFLLHHLEPFLSTQADAEGGEASSQSQPLQSQPYGLSRLSHV